MSMHLQLWATGFYGISQADGLGPHSRRAYEALGRFWQIADWVLTGTYRRNIARERARDRRDFWREFQGMSRTAERHVAKLIWTTRRGDAWNTLLASH